MPSNLNPQLIEQLEQYRVRGKSFAEAKFALLSAGWLEDDIDRARTEVDFDEMGDASDESSGQTVSVSEGIVSEPDAPKAAPNSDQFWKDFGLSGWGLAPLFVVPGFIVIWFTMPKPVVWLAGIILTGAGIWRLYILYLKK